MTSEKTNSHHETDLPAAYQILPPFEKSLIQLASIIYEPVNRIIFTNCLRRAQIAGPEGEWLTLAAVGPYLQKLQDSNLLLRDCRCPDEIIELATREAVAAGVFGNMVRAVQTEMPFSQYQSRLPQRCLRAMREP